MFEMVYLTMRKLLIYLLLAATIFGLLASSEPGSSSQVSAQGGYKTWTVWWAPLSSPWVYKEETRMGGYKFMKYSHSADYTQLQQEFNAMLAYHKPHAIVVLYDFKDIYPPRWSQNSSLPSNHPRGNNKINDFVDFNNPDFDYYDDLVELARSNGVEVYFRVNNSVSGGMSPYPFSYYSNVGWYWCRPDWGPNLTVEQKISQGYCLADPATDAMRHPPAARNGSNYNWIEHIIAYENSTAHPNGRHFALTSNGVEMEHLGQAMEVYESPDMVFNGLDTDLGVHTPLASFSSDAYLNFTKKLVSESANHFKDKVNVKGYLLWEEPSYAHLRENMVFTTGYSGNRDYEIGEQTDYQVDYSAAELQKYNAWRGTRNEPPVSQIPFPQNSNYELFKKHNLARFMNELANTIRAGDGNAQVIYPYYYDNNLHLPEIDFNLANSIIRPDGVYLEPESHYSRNFNNSQSWLAFANNAKRTNSALNLHLSGYTGTNNYHTFLQNGLTDYFAPGFVTTGLFSGGNSVGNYNIWAGCTPSRVECQILQPSTNTNSCIPDCVTRSCSQGDGCGGVCTQCQGGGVTPQQVIDAFGNSGGPADLNSDGVVNGVDFVRAL